MLDWGKIYYLVTLLICERWKSNDKHYFCPLMVNCRIFIILINNPLQWTCPWHTATSLLIGEIISKQVSSALFWCDPPLKKNRSLKPKPIFRSSLMKFFLLGCSNGSSGSNTSSSNGSSNNTSGSSSNSGNGGNGNSGNNGQQWAATAAATVERERISNQSDSLIWRSNLFVIQLAFVGVRKVERG